LFLFLFKIKDEKLMKLMIDYRTYYKILLDNESYNVDYLIQTIHDLFKDVPFSENNQKNQKIKILEDIKPYIKDMRKCLLSQPKK